MEKTLEKLIIKNIMKRPFKIGDKVKIVKKVEKITKWNNLEKMDITLGMIGTIINIINGYYRINFIDLDKEWNYDFECLKLIKKAELKKVPKWKKHWKDI